MLLRLLFKPDFQLLERLIPIYICVRYFWHGSFSLNSPALPVLTLRVFTKERLVELLLTTLYSSITG